MKLSQWIGQLIPTVDPKDWWSKFYKMLLLMMLVGVWPVGGILIRSVLLR